MKDLQSYANRCLKMLDGVGILYGSITGFVVDTRPKRRYGQCRKRGLTFEIGISKFMLDDSIPDKALENTIIHEVLHTIDGCQNHGSKWKHYAGIVKEHLGYDIRRCNGDKEGLPVTAQFRYAVRCTGCGMVFRRMKRTDLIKYPEWYRCGKCHSKLVRV